VSSSSILPRSLAARAGTLTFKSFHRFQELTGRERGPLGEQAANDSGERVISPDPNRGDRYGYNVWMLFSLLASIASVAREARVRCGLICFRTFG
jgi:hypothetical protein